MKKILLILAVIFLIVFAKNKYEDMQIQKHANDINRINRLISACAKVASSEKILEADRYVTYEAGLIHSEKKEPFIYMESILGEDYKSRLSNGDSLWFTFDIDERTFKIYARDWESEDNMIYPTWNYSRIKP